MKAKGARTVSKAGGVTPLFRNAELLLFHFHSLALFSLPLPTQPLSQD